MFTAVRAVGAGGAALVVVLLAQPRLEVAVHLPRRHESPFFGGREREGVFSGPQFCPNDFCGNVIIGPNFFDARTGAGLELVHIALPPHFELAYGVIIGLY